MKLEEYQKRNEELKDKYNVHERINSYQNDYKKDRDLKNDDIEKRKKIDEGFCYFSLISHTNLFRNQ